MMEAEKNDLKHGAIPLNMEKTLNLWAWVAQPPRRVDRHLLIPF